MARKALSDRSRMAVALDAAAYMRWVETRKGQSPTADMTEQFIKGSLDREGYSYDSEEIQLIEILALSIKIDVVETFIEQSNVFAVLDAAAKRQRAIVDGFSLVVAASLGLWVKYELEATWYAAIGVAALAFVMLPFIITRLWALYLMRRIERTAQLQQ
jgi:hypothetical protein